MRSGPPVGGPDETRMIRPAGGHDNRSNPRSGRDPAPDCCGYSKGLTHTGHVVRAW
jgi:hypothetical protein